MLTLLSLHYYLGIESLGVELGYGYSTNVAEYPARLVCDTQDHVDGDCIPSAYPCNG